MPCSLVILYSNDRRQQLERSLALWQDVAGYDDCEKILCVDGIADWRPEHFQVIEIPRRGKHYCWADTLNTGVKAAKHPFVFYFDADRIVSTDFLTRGLDILQVKDGFVFAKKLFSVKLNLDEEDLRMVRDYPMGHTDLLIGDHRTLDPLDMGRKNPFAGGVGFRRETFLEYGGFDPRFVGWGYPDYDFFMNVHRRAPHAFYPLDAVELHQHHGYSVTKRELELQNLWNCAQYVRKWEITTPYLLNTCKHLKVKPETLKAATLDAFLAAQ